MKSRVAFMLAAACVLVAAPFAHAGLYGEIGKGLALFDVQLTGERNLLGDGMTVNAAANYNNRKFDFGVADLTLTGAVRGSAGFTTRGLPAVNFQLSSGLANSPSPLTYNFNLFNGIENVQSSGSVLVNINTKVNALGFYQESVQISNRGTFDINGVTSNSGSTDYDIGPVNVQGNIFADALVSLTQPYYDAQGTENPFAKFSGKAQKADLLEKEADSLRDRMAAGEQLTSDEIGRLVNDTVLAALLGGTPDEKLFEGLLVPTDGGELNLDSLSVARFAPTPEPATLGLLLLAAGGLVLRRRAR